MSVDEKKNIEATVDTGYNQHVFRSKSKVNKCLMTTICAMIARAG